LPEQVSVHDPALARSGRRTGLLNYRRHLGQRAREQNLIGCAQVGAPVDLQLSAVQLAEGTVAVEQDDGVVCNLGLLRRKLSACCNLHGLTNAVQGNAVTCRECLHGGNTRYDFVVKRDPWGNLTQDPDCAVVKRRVSPDQEGAAVVLTELLREERLVNGG